MSLATVRDRLRASLWFVPAVGVVAGGLLAQAMLAADNRMSSSGWLAFSGGPSSARALLSAVATSLVTLTALVFSITVVVLQLASSQYSSRILRTFLRDRMSQLALGSFLATFVATMLVLRAVRGDDDIDAFVPKIAVHVVLAMTVVCLGMFVAYVHHVARGIQASTIVASVAEETAAVLRRLYPHAGDDEPAVQPPGPLEHHVVADRSGYLQEVRTERLLHVAATGDLVVRLRCQPGDFVAEGARLYDVSRDVAGSDDVGDDLLACIVVGTERTPLHDAAFGFRQLVDVAVRALSPGINDPTTAVQALDRIHQLLLVLAPRRIPSPVRTDDAGSVRLHLPRPGWDDYLDLAFDAIRRNAHGFTQVIDRLAHVQAELWETAPPARRLAVERHRQLLAAGGR